MDKLKALVLAAAILVLPIAAHAQLAYTASTTAVHAGPARDYPIVAVLGSGLAVSVQGCMPDYQWCDVIAGEYRGWVYAGDIAHAYQGERVPVIDYGAAIGIGVVSFVLGNYWADHYISHPWYRQMPHWSRRPQAAAVHSGRPHAQARMRREQPAAPVYRSRQRPAAAGVVQRPQQVRREAGRDSRHRLSPRPRHER